MNPTEPNHEPAATDKPWQFSLKSLVITLTGCSVLFGLIAAGALPFVLGLFALAGATMAAAMLLAYLFNHPRVAAVCVSGVALLFLASMLPSRARQSRPVFVPLAAQTIDTVDLGRENLRQIAAALDAYHDQHGRLPPAYTEDAEGNRLHSWRTLILPYLGRDDLFQQIRLDEPWDSPFNRRFHQSVVNLYASPSNSSRQPNTAYVAVTGPETAWPGSKSISLDQIGDESNTILVVGMADSDIHWMEPRDLDIERALLDIGLSDGQGMSSRDRAEISVLYADGIVDDLPEWMQPDELRPLFTITRDDDTFR